MRPPWSSLMPVLAAVAVAQTFVAAAADAGETGFALLRANADGLNAATLVVPVAEHGSDAWLQLQQWINQNYQRAPALMLGLSVLLAVPPLALAGLFMRRNKRRTSNATVMLPKRARRPSRTARRTTLQTEFSPWPTEAWVEAEGIPGGRRIIGRTLVRIGREEDNDIRFALKTVHRYHAVIRRTTDGVVMITDLSGKDGNGVLVNGTRVAEARLSKGDVINLGEVKMRFDARPV